MILPPPLGQARGRRWRRQRATWRRARSRISRTCPSKRSRNFKRNKKVHKTSQMSIKTTMNKHINTNIKARGPAHLRRRRPRLRKGDHLALFVSPIVRIGWLTCVELIAPRPCSPKEKEAKKQNKRRSWIPFGDHPLKLERCREDKHGPCARMTHTNREV